MQRVNTTHLDSFPYLLIGHGARGCTHDRRLARCAICDGRHGGRYDNDQ